MKKSQKLVILFLAASMLLSGCVMRTVDELYCLPKRHQADDDLQKVIDQTMVGLSYSAPLYGENKQMIQPVDLDGDGITEYIVLARDSVNKSLKLLIFSQLAVGYVLTDTIESYGSAFDFIAFSNLDDHPGVEIIVGRLVGEGVVRSAAVYRLTDGKMEQLLEVSYSALLNTDLDKDGRGEIFVVRPENNGDITSAAVLYRYQNGQIQCSSQLEISTPSSAIKKLENITLEDGSSAVLVTCGENNIQTMEIFNFNGGELRRAYGPVSMEKLNGYFVYPTDADCDGDTELPELIPIKNADGTDSNECWIRWYGLYSNGTTTSGMYTYYSYADKWYLHMDQAWIDNLTVTRSDGVCTFTNFDKEVVMTIYALSGSNRKEQANQLDGAVLGSSETVTFVAVIGPGAETMKITKQRVKQLFYPIELKLYTQEG